MIRAEPAAIAAILVALGSPAGVKIITNQMKTVGPNGSLIVFDPPFVSASVGVDIHLVPSDPGHNAETIAGMILDGATPVKGTMNKEVVLKVDRPGLYGIKCLPHFAMGRVALVDAGSGTASNLAAARAAKLPPLAAKEMAPLLARAK